MISAVTIDPPNGGTATFAVTTEGDYTYIVPAAKAKIGWRFKWFVVEGRSKTGDEPWTPWTSEALLTNPPTGADREMCAEYTDIGWRRISAVIDKITAFFELPGNHQILRSAATGIILRGSNGLVLRYD